MFVSGLHFIMEEEKKREFDSDKLSLLMTVNSLRRRGNETVIL